jgi:hypothetical protein
MPFWRKKKLIKKLPVKTTSFRGKKKKKKKRKKKKKNNGLGVAPWPPHGL